MKNNKNSNSSMFNRLCRCSPECLFKITKKLTLSLMKWLLSVEMSIVWSTASISIILFMFSAIWYIDPALLTLILAFRKATCISVKAEHLIGISKCAWTSCREGCTKEIHQCWHIWVNYTFDPDSKAYTPPWNTISDIGTIMKAKNGPLSTMDHQNASRLYPNVRGCGYPPQVNCENFYKNYSAETEFACWVSTMDSTIAIANLDLDRLKIEMMFSFIPLFVFIIFVLYAFCRLNVFSSICNPFKYVFPRANDSQIDVSGLSVQSLFEYKNNILAASIGNKKCKQGFSDADEDWDHNAPISATNCDEKECIPMKTLLQDGRTKHSVNFQDEFM